jgi:hypothetical protein
MAEPSLSDKVVRLHEALDAAGVGHAFGGALALAYYGEPRTTVDIDVNVFRPPAAYHDVLAVLRPLGIDRTPPGADVERDGQARVWWGRNPVDLFFAYDPLHDAMRRAARVVPFGRDSIPVLGPEHLLVAKVAFNRAKDWLDIEQMLVAVDDLDLDEVHRWLDRLLAPGDDRFARLRDLETRLLGRS